MSRASTLCLVLLFGAACEASPEPNPIPAEPATDRTLDDEPPPTTPLEITELGTRDELVLVFGGDVNLGRDVGQRILADQRFDPFEGVRSLLSRADLAFVNLESTISDQGGETRHPTENLAFTSPPAGAGLLARAPVQIVSVANNHMWDYGKDGFIETLGHLREAGIAYAGGSDVVGQQYEPTVVRVAGWSIAVFAVTEVWNPGTFEAHEGRHHIAWANAENLASRVARAKAAHSFVIVSYHGGREYSDSPAVEPIVFATAVMDAGADVFVGHHPHVPQGIRYFGHRPAFYSLGNLVFGRHKDHAWTARGFLMRVTLGEIDSVEACPYVLEREIPRLLAEPDGEVLERGFRSHLTRISKNASAQEIALGGTGPDGCIPVTRAH